MRLRRKSSPPARPMKKGTREPIAEAAAATRL
jgi:hypothetical protein